MNKLKKLLILVLSFLAISSFAFGCGSGEKTSNSNNSSVLSTQSSSSEISSEQSSSSVEQSSSSSTQTTLSYRVEYYLKNLNDNDYTLEESWTENLTGIEGSIVYAPIKI